MRRSDGSVLGPSHAPLRVDSVLSQIPLCGGVVRGLASGGERSILWVGAVGFSLINGGVHSEGAFEHLGLFVYE